MRGSLKRKSKSVCHSHIRINNNGAGCHRAEICQKMKQKFSQTLVNSEHIDEIVSFASSKKKKKKITF